MSKPRLLMISKIFPFPRSSGQQQRVYYTLKALRQDFHITFLTSLLRQDQESYRKKLEEFCDEVIIIPSRFGNFTILDLFYKLLGLIFVLFSGLKFSNFLIGKLELSPGCIRKFTGSQTWDIVLYEYWHAADSLPIFQKRNIPCILDTHNVLWLSQKRQLDSVSWLPNFVKTKRVSKYKNREENAWKKFDALIAINKGEYDYIKSVVGKNVQVFYTPMGTDLDLWPYCYQPVTPPRIAYYGGLGSEHNQKDAIYCYEKIMPLIWEKFPNTEFWIIGSNPPGSIKELPRKDARVVVTGFIANVQEVLKFISVVLCPWSGTYGFRSRLIEVMALGIPVVASSDAVFGMDLKQGEGLYTMNHPNDMASCVIDLLSNPEFKIVQSKLARRQVEEKFSYYVTYLQFSQELLSYVAQKI